MQTVMGSTISWRWSRLCKVPKAKICVASQPETVLYEELHTSPSCRSQDLTKEDIRKFSVDTLTPVWDRLSIQHQSMHTQASIVDLILEKAEGVFLWARLVVSHVRNGLIRYDDWNTLYNRIEELPTKLAELYTIMWKRHNQENKVYRANTALYLKLLIYDGTIQYGAMFSVPSLLFATDGVLQRQYLENHDYLSNREVEEKVRVFQHQLIARCVGFVELGDLASGAEDLTAHSGVLDLSTQLRVRFIHKFVVEFLWKTTADQEIVESAHTSVLELCVRAFTSQLITHIIINKTGASFTLWLRMAYGYIHDLACQSHTPFLKFASQGQIISKIVNLAQETLEQVPE